MAGLKGQARVPNNTDARIRRNAAGFASDAESMFGGALTLVEGVMVLSLGVDSALDQTNGLVVVLKTAGSGLKQDGPGLYVDSAVYLSVAAAAAAYVPLTRTVSTTAPLTGGGALSGDITLAIPAATNSVDGYLTAADHTTFGGKADYSFGANAFTGTGAFTTTDLSTASLFQISTAPTDNSTGTVAIVAKDTNLLTANAGWLPFKRSDGTTVFVPYWL